MEPQVEALESREGITRAHSAASAVKVSIQNLDMLSSVQSPWRKRALYLCSR